MPRQELKVKRKARKINGLQILEGRIYTQFTRKIKMFLGCDMAKIKYVYCRGSHAKLSRWQGTDLQRYVL